MLNIVTNAFSDTWFWVTIVTPVVLPSIGATILMLFPIPGGVNVMSTLKDGQLGWVVVVMASAAVYEAVETMNKVPGWESGATLICGAIGFIFVGTIIAVCGALFSPPLRCELPEPYPPWLKHYRVFAVSLILTVAAAFQFTAMHYEAQQLHEHALHKSNTDPSIRNDTALPPLFLVPIPR